MTLPVAHRLGLGEILCVTTRTPCCSAFPSAMPSAGVRQFNHKPAAQNGGCNANVYSVEFKEESPVKRWRVCTLLVFVTVRLVSAQQLPSQSITDPYQPTLDRLESLTTLPLSGWRFHADVPHPEDSSSDDSGWETVRVGDKWSTGPRVLRRWIEIPEKINGYAVRFTGRSSLNSTE
jgi:hypothetical protein